MVNLIGVDEAGRGPVMGPLVVAGFKLDSEDKLNILKELGVRDSKKCTPKRRDLLAIELKKVGSYYIKITTASEIDENRKVKTLNVLEAELFSDVINKLSPDKNSTIIVDSADANENTFRDHIKSRINDFGEIISMHKADEIHLIVAAASILAKTERDSQVQKIANELKADIGSGYPADPITDNFLEKWIKEKGDLPPHTRHSWNTIKRLMKKVKSNTSATTLDQFDDND